MVEHFIFNALDGKVENAYELTKQMGGMIFSRDSDTDVETRTVDREPVRKLAEYLAQNYLSDYRDKASMFSGVIQKTI